MATKRVLQRGFDGHRQHVVLPRQIAVALQALARRRFTSVSALLKELAIKELDADRRADG